MERSTASVDDYLASPGEPGEDLRTLDGAIAPVFAGKDRVLWEGRLWGGDQRIVGYGLYTYHGRSGASGDWFIVGTAAVKGHLSMHVSGAEDNVALVKRYGAGLGKVKIGSGVVTFSRLADVDLDAIVALATRARDSIGG
jgi:hypothetical protein